MLNPRLKDPPRGNLRGLHDPVRQLEDVLHKMIAGLEAEQRRPGCTATRRMMITGRLAWLRDLNRRAAA